ncbi:hypothetical protein JXR93_00750, partial [bacterium]|nr:hypothetical protein [bacterium]
MIFLFLSLSLLFSDTFVCRAPELYKYREHKKFTISKQKSDFLKQLKKYSDKIQKINYFDAIFIKDFYKKTGVKSVEIDDFLKSFKKDGNFTKKFIKNRDFILKNNLSKAIQKNPWNYMGSFIEFYRAICNVDSDDKAIYELIAKGDSCEIRNDIKNSWSIDNFFEMAKKGDELIYNADSGFPYLTPFVAKMILVEFMDYYLKNSKKSTLRTQFWAGITHKLNVGEFKCGHFCELSSAPFINNLDYYTTHMGYVLVHSITSGHFAERVSNEFNNLLENIELETPQTIDEIALNLNSKQLDILKNSEIDTIGIECSYYVQRVLEEMNYSIKGRLKSSNMESKLSKGVKIAKKREFFSEELLNQGDIIQQKGHTWVFAGYGEPNNSKNINRYSSKYSSEHKTIYILTFEAVGNRARTVGLFYRMMPYEKKNWLHTSCDINEVWDNENGFKPVSLDEFQY